MQGWQAVHYKLLPLRMHHQQGQIRSLAQYAKAALESPVLSTGAVGAGVGAGAPEQRPQVWAQ